MTKAKNSCLEPRQRPKVQKAKNIRTTPWSLDRKYAGLHNITGNDAKSICMKKRKNAGVQVVNGKISKEK